MGKTQGSVNLSEAIDTFVVANDPRFLFTRLRRDASVEAIASQKSPDRIVAWINRHAKRLPDTIEGLVRVYVHLIALALHERTDVLRSVKKMRTGDVPWVPVIVEYVLDSLKATTYTRQHCTVPRGENTTALSTSATSNISISASASSGSERNANA